MSDELDLGYLLAVAGAAVWMPRPLVAMLGALGSARALVEFARRASQDREIPCERLGVEALARIAAIDDRSANHALVEARQGDHQFVTSADPRYPSRLYHLCDPPPVLYYRGNLECLKQRVVAIVGSRGATPYGRSMARTITTDFAVYGVTIVSGLARGIDAAAHRAANDAGMPTVAVIGSGLSSLYPPYHHSLADEIIEKGGAVITEFPPKMNARQHHFPMRNRLVASLAEAVIVVEAGVKSGALITARLAAELGRNVFAVPGDVGRTTSEGTNALIKDGVTLTTGAKDIADVLGWGCAIGCNRSSSLARSGESPILAALAPGGSDVDEICAATGLDVASVSAQLTLLEMRGLVERQAGGLYLSSKVTA
jgi:DNA processing protein